MDTVLITTLFVAPPARLTEAYALYRTRANAADAAILAQSTHPRPATDDPYTLWELRSEAAFYRLTQPQKMELFELRSLVRYNSDDDKIFDRVHEKFFFEDHDEPTVFPGQVSQSPSVKLPESAPERMPGQLRPSKSSLRKWPPSPISRTPRAASAPKTLISPGHCGSAIRRTLRQASATARSP